MNHEAHEHDISTVKVATTVNSRRLANETDLTCSSKLGRLYNVYMPGLFVEIGDVLPNDDRQHTAADRLLKYGRGSLYAPRNEEVFFFAKTKETASRFVLGLASTICIP